MRKVTVRSPLFCIDPDRTSAAFASVLQVIAAIVDDQDGILYKCRRRICTSRPHCGCKYFDGFFRGFDAKLRDCTVIHGI